jgi:hypothetical protein
LPVRTKPPAAAPDITHISQLRSDPRNPRRRTPRSADRIAHSLQTLGAGRSIVIDEEGQIIAGNGVVEAAGQVGIEKVRVIEADGNEIIAVRRTNLSPEQKVQLSIADNRTGELSEWDDDVLAALSDEGFDTSDWFRPDELQELLSKGEADGIEEHDEEPDYGDPDDPTRGQPLAIVLEPDELRRWRMAKDELGYSRDKIALMKLVDAYLAEIHPAEAG